MFDSELEQVRREIGVRLRALRERIGITQCQLAEAVGHKSSHRINQIELGRTRLYAEELPKICRELNCAAADLLPEAVPSRRPEG